MAIKTITIKNGEGKWIPFRVTSTDAVTGVNTNVDLSNAILRFVVKVTSFSATYKVNKLDADFDKTDAARGLVRVNIPASENTATLLPPRKYQAEFKAIFTSDTDEDISERLILSIEESLF